MNYAEFLLQDGRLKEISAVLGGHFSLTQMYPHRDVFHISEVVAFYSFLGRYRVTEGDLDQAESILRFLKDPGAEPFFDARIEGHLLDYIRSHLPNGVAMGRAGAAARCSSDAWAVHARPESPASSPRPHASGGGKGSILVVVPVTRRANGSPAGDVGRCHEQVYRVAGQIRAVEPLADREMPQGRRRDPAGRV